MVVATYNIQRSLPVFYRTRQVSECKQTEGTRSRYCVCETCSERGKQRVMVRRACTYCSRERRDRPHTHHTLRTGVPAGAVVGKPRRRSFRNFETVVDRRTERAAKFLCLGFETDHGYFHTRTRAHSRSEQDCSSTTLESHISANRVGEDRLLFCEWGGGMDQIVPDRMTMIYCAPTQKSVCVCADARVLCAPLQPQATTRQSTAVIFV